MRQFFLPNTVLKKCSICNTKKPHAQYSDKQWAKNQSASDRKCKHCVEALLNSGSLTASILPPSEPQWLQEVRRNKAEVDKMLFAEGVLVRASPEEIAREKLKFQQSPPSLEETLALLNEDANKLLNGQPLTVYPESILQ